MNPTVRTLVRAILVASTLVTIATAHRAAAADATFVQTSGTVLPREVIDVSAQIGGTVQKLGDSLDKKDKTIDFGSFVKKGTVLAELDAAVYQADLNKAKADLQKAEATLQLAKSKVALAELEYQRARRLAAEKGGDTFSVDSARAALDVAQATLRNEAAAVDLARANVQIAEINVGYCTIKSPCDGIVLARRVNPGQVVANSPLAPSLFMIAKDLKHMVVWAAVSESDIARIAQGQPAKFTVDALPGKEFSGKVTQIRLNGTSNKGKVMFTVVIEPDPTDEKLLPYLTANVQIDTSSKPMPHDQNHLDAEPAATK